jgi:NADH-quinone oxidoreductase subunit J
MSVLAATAAQNAELVGFLVLAPASVIAALAMVFSRNAIYAALLLVVNLFCLAVLFLFLQAQFIAAVQVIVYAGAIMILFLFVLMLLGVRRDEKLSDLVRTQGVVALVLGAVLLGGLAAGVAAAAVPDGSEALAETNANGNVEALGRLLFTRYTLAFEATGVLLLVAGVGALVLARRVRGDDDDDPRERARQRPPRPQAATDAEPDPELAGADDAVAATATGTPAASQPATGAATSADSDDRRSA